MWAIFPIIIASSPPPPLPPPTAINQEEKEKDENENKNEAERRRSTVRGVASECILEEEELGGEASWSRRWGDQWASLLSALKAVLRRFQTAGRGLLSSGHPAPNTVR